MSSYLCEGLMKNDQVIRQHVWTPEEHERFHDGLERFPRGPWQRVANCVGSKSARQTRSHAKSCVEKIKRKIVKDGIAARSAQRQSTPSRTPNAALNAAPNAAPHAATHAAPNGVPPVAPDTAPHFAQRANTQATPPSRTAPRPLSDQPAAASAQHAAALGTPPTATDSIEDVEFPPRGCKNHDSFVCAVDRLGGDLTGEEALELLLKILSLARRHIRIAIFCFTHPEIAKHLERMLRFNKRLRLDLLVDSRMAQDSRSVVRALYEAHPTQVVLVYAKKTLHVKEVLVDDQYVVTGPANLTKRGLHVNVESMMVFRAGPVFTCALHRWCAAFTQALYAQQSCEPAVHKVQPAHTTTASKHAEVMTSISQATACFSAAMSALVVQLTVQKQADVSTQSNNQRRLDDQLEHNHQLFIVLHAQRDDNQLLREQMRMEHEERMLQCKLQHEERARQLELQLAISQQQHAELQQQNQQHHQQTTALLMVHLRSVLRSQNP